MTAMIVPEVLQAYAERGVLRNFSGDGGTTFDFKWLTHKPMKLQWDAVTRTLTFSDVLPNIPATSTIYRELQAFVDARAAAGLPDHRRVDPADFALHCQNEQGRVSVGMRVVGGGEEDAARKLMLVMHEVFLMMHDRWPDYMQEEFDASAE